MADTPTTNPEPVTAPQGKGFPLVGFVASVWLAVFAAIWLWIGWEVWQFSPTASNTRWAASGIVKTLAGATAGSIGAATASSLGIKVQQLKAQGANVAVRVRQSVGSSAVLAVAVVVYVTVGVAVGFVLVANPDEAPDMVDTFIVGVAGWMAGAMAAMGAGPTE